MYYSYLLRQIKKALVLLLIVSFPSIFLYLLAVLTKKPIETSFVQQIPFMSLTLIASAFIQIPNSQKFYGITVFAYFIFPFLFMSVVSINLALLQLSLVTKTDGVKMQDYIMLAVSLLYFILVNSNNELRKDFDNPNKTIVKYSIELKIPSFLRKLGTAKNQFLKNVFYILFRLLIYTSFSIFMTYLLRKYYPFENNIPNFFGVFSTIWTVITFVGELLITSVRRNE